MNCFGLTTTINTLANAIVCQISDDDELELIAAAFTQLGDTIATILACKALQHKSSDSYLTDHQNS